MSEIDGGGLDQMLAPPEDFLQRLDADISGSGGEILEDPGAAGAIGVTMFDVPSSEDGSLTVLLPRESIPLAPSQALLRINSGDKRSYLGIVSAGPFAEPDSLRGDSPMLVTVATRGGIYLPPYHGRVQVALLGEENADGTLSPPRLRPLPTSPVFALTIEQSVVALHAGGDIQLGLIAGKDKIDVGIPSTDKAALPRHTAVLGTTGSGKSTTVARLACQAQQANMAVIVLDVEGEYTYLHEPTEDQRMLTALTGRGQVPDGVPKQQMSVYHLVGRETANPNHPNRRAFSLQFARLSPYAAIEILGLTEAQATRFLKAYDIAKELLRALGIFPQPRDEEQERQAAEIDEFERGYPRLTLSLLMDVVGACLAKTEKTEPKPRDPAFQTSDGHDALMKSIAAAEIPSSAVSWRALIGRLARLNRLKVFDIPEKSDDRRLAKPLNYGSLLKPGTVSVIDLSDSGASELSNIVIADLLRGVQEAQDTAYDNYEKARKSGQTATKPTPILVIIEEAHEFLSAERVDKMPILFEQVAKIAKRGRKRWLGLVFVTQLPQHLPRQVFGLVNSYILHKISDPLVVSTLQRTVSGIDEGLWKRLPGLAPGQAIVSFPHMARPLLIAVDPTPAKLRMVD